MHRHSISWWPAALAAVVLVSVANPAHAEESTLQPAVTMKAEWYGWQTLLVDSVTLGTIPLELGSSVSFAKTPSASYLLVGSLSGYALGAPLVHAAHGHWQRGLADLGLHVGALAVGGLVGGAAGGMPTSCDVKLAGCFTQSNNSVMVGAMLGAVLASVVDSSLLAWDAKPREAAEERAPRWSPTAVALPGGAVGGVAGTF
jgi:hypothetical protein